MERSSKITGILFLLFAIFSLACVSATTYHYAERQEGEICSDGYLKKVTYILECEKTNPDLSGACVSGTENRHGHIFELITPLQSCGGNQHPHNHHNHTNNNSSSNFNWTISNLSVTPNPVVYSGNSILLTASLHSNYNLTSTNLTIYNSTSRIANFNFGFTTGSYYLFLISVPANLSYENYTINITLRNTRGESRTLFLVGFNYFNQTTNPNNSTNNTHHDDEDEEDSDPDEEINDEEKISSGLLKTISPDLRNIGNQTMQIIELENKNSFSYKNFIWIMLGLIILLFVAIILVYLLKY